MHSQKKDLYFPCKWFHPYISHILTLLAVNSFDNENLEQYLTFLFYTSGLKLPLSKRKISLLLKMEKNHNFLKNLRHLQNFFLISEGPEKNLFGKKKFMGVLYMAKLEFWLQT